MLCAGLFAFAYQTEQHYPIAEWLFIRYAAYVLGAALVSVAAL